MYTMEELVEMPFMTSAMRTTFRVFLRIFESSESIGAPYIFSNKAVESSVGALFRSASTPVTCRIDAELSQQVHHSKLGSRKTRCFLMIRVVADGHHTKPARRGKLHSFSSDAG